MSKTFSSDKEAADQLHKTYQEINQEISKVIVGQQEALKLVLMSIFSKGHCLLVGVPGLAKTLLIKTVASVLHLKFNRIQFTPDLMPSDIIGAETLDKDRNFQFIKGPIFSNIILADEINRTPPKTQSALLESMQEYTVTVAGKKYELEQPFFVLATQNPIEQEGTYPLPEAQQDRFMFNIKLDYPSYEDEVEVVKRTTQIVENSVKQILSGEDIIKYQRLIQKVPVPDNVISYAVELVNKTRPKNDRATKLTNEFIEWGAGPRASQYLVIAAKCNALLKGKYSPDIEEVQEVAIPILRHRIFPNFKAEAEGYSVEKLIEELL